MVLPKAKLTRSDFCVQWSALLPEHSTVFPISPKSPSSQCSSIPSPISWGKWQWDGMWGNMSAGWNTSSYMLMGPGSWKVTIAFPSVRSLSWGSPNSCQLSQKLWKSDIFGISASSSDWIEIDPAVSKLLGRGEGEVMGQAAQVIGLILTWKN